MVTDWLYYNWKEVSSLMSHWICCPLKCQGLAINNNHWKDVYSIWPGWHVLYAFPIPPALLHNLKDRIDNTWKGGKKKTHHHNRTQADKYHVLCSRQTLYHGKSYWNNWYLPFSVHGHLALWETMSFPQGTNIVENKTNISHFSTFRRKCKNTINCLLGGFKRDQNEQSGFYWIFLLLFPIISFFHSKREMVFLTIITSYEIKLGRKQNQRAWETAHI